MKCRWLASVFGTTLVAIMASQAVAAVDLTNQAISDKVEDELLVDPAVVSSQIDVETVDGVVKLSGSVDNLLAKERAARVAETVKGVRAVVNQVKVTPPIFRSDRDIQRDVQSALLNDPAADAFELESSVNDGVVTLSGTVDSYQERELARTVAKGVRGVVAIDDEIDIQYKSERPDLEIETEIEQALRWDAHIDDALISVDVDDGAVELAGTVGSAAEKRMAASAAWVAGVDSVDDTKLKVEKWARDEKLRGTKFALKTSDEIREAVNDALLYDPRVSSFPVDVDVVGSTVTLRGEVDNLKAKRAAEQDAKNTVGVATVANRIKVRPDDGLSDAEIADDIRSALLRSPYIDRFELTVSVTNGIAHLYGDVDTYYERHFADDLVARVPGVIDVANHLAVDDDRPYIHDPYVEVDLLADTDVVDYEPRVSGMTDSQIKESIESELWWSPFVDSDQVDVAVDDAIATLTGTVDTWGEWNAATENAYEGGATLVDNDLLVSSE